MRQRLICLFCLLSATPAFAQLSLVPNRMIYFDYDKYGTTAGCPDVPDNGIYFSCLTQNVTFDMSKGAWKADLLQTINGTTYSSTIYPPWSKIGYYPAVGSNFAWYIGPKDPVTGWPTNMDLLGDGYLQCNGYDGSTVELNVEGDLAPGPVVNGVHQPNGVLFRRPADSVYRINGAFPLLWMGLSVQMNGVTAYEEAVYPTSFCWFIPTPN